VLLRKDSIAKNRQATILFYVLLL